jgi:hypothetical protein
MAFDRPDAPGRDPESPQFDQKAHLGDLLVLQVQSAERGVETQFGPADVITADVFVIDPAGTIREQYQDAWLFGTVLFSQLREKRGRSVLGVLEQGEKKPGKNPPWRLADPTDAQEELALRAMASKPDKPVEVQPAAQPAAAAASGKAPWE